MTEIPDKITCLQEASDEDLLKELLGRYDHALFSGLKVDKRGNDVLYDYKGDDLMIVELAADIIHDCRCDEFEDEDDETI